MVFNPKKQLSRYSPKAFTLVPLHRWDDKKRTKSGAVKDIGKAPIHHNWTRREYDSRKVLDQCLAQGRNVGVRMTDEQLIIDIDPRNGGDDGFDALCADLGLDPDEWPTVTTGSGGRHCYMAKPANVLVRDTLGDIGENNRYPGVEFKSKGRQVVAAGSKHPNGKFYKWDMTKPNIEDGLPMAPTMLLNMIRRPPASANSGGGQLDQVDVAKLLADLDITKFKDETAWRRVMMACHHASDGNARSEFVEWSIGDPDYANQADIIGRRWDSCHVDKAGGITLGTLNHILQKHGKAPYVPPNNPEDDFDPADDEMAVEESNHDGDEAINDDGEEIEAESGAEFAKRKPKKNKDGAVEGDWLGLEGESDEKAVKGLNADGTKIGKNKGISDKSTSMLTELNDKYLCVLDRGKFRIMTQQKIHIGHSERTSWVPVDRQSFESFYANRKVERDMEGLSRNAQTTIPLGEAWIKWPGRREVSEIIFDPNKEDDKSVLNTWTGFAVPAQPGGSWEYTRELIYDVIADGNQVVGDYIVNWLAYMFQHPSERAETAIVLQGAMGVGKGTLGNIIVDMCGQHGLAIGSSDLLTGRFNAHMQDLVFLFADEAVNPYERGAESKLRHIITEPNIQVEQKGVDSYRVKNMLHIFMASNDDWVVPAGRDERRYMVQRVSPKWKNTDKWGKLHAELKAKGNSGYKAMMFELMNRKFPEGREPGTLFHPREMPHTKALIDQKIFSMKPLNQFLHNVIRERNVTWDHQGSWTEGPVTFFFDDFRDAFNSFCRSSNINAGSSGRNNNYIMGQQIREILPTAKTEIRRKPLGDQQISVAPHDGKAPAIEFPALHECAELFEKNMNFPAGHLGIKPPKPLTFEG